MKKTTHKDHILMVDTGCDLLSVDFFDNGKIGNLPYLLRTDNNDILDSRDQDSMLKLYKSNLFSIKESTISTAPEDSVIKSSILHYLNSVMKDGGKPTTLHIQQADMTRAFAYRAGLISIYKEFMDHDSKFYKDVTKIVATKNFSIKLYDTKQFFTGQALVALETYNLLKRNTCSHPSETINKFIPHVETFMLPRDLSYMRKRAREKGEKSINKFKEILSKFTGIIPIIKLKNSKTTIYSKQRFQANALKFIIIDLKQKLKAHNGPILSSNVCISYAGDLNNFYSKFKKELAILKIIAIRYNLTVNYSIASSAAGINIGPKSIFISYAL